MSMIVIHIFFTVGIFLHENQEPKSFLQVLGHVLNNAHCTWYHTSYLYPSICREDNFGRIFNNGNVFTQNSMTYFANKEV